MRRVWLIAVVLGLGSGCASDGAKKPWWDDALKDLRGDNMKMRSDSSSMMKEIDHDTKVKPAN